MGGTALGTELRAHGAIPRAPNFLMEKHKQDLIKTSCSGNSKLRWTSVLGGLEILGLHYFVPFVDLECDP